MDVVTMPIGNIRPYARNPRKNDTAVDAVAASLTEFGWRNPIVVDENNVIVCGHTRWKAAKKLGMVEIPVHVARGLSAEKIAALRLADNKTGELAEWDFEKLDLELADIDLDMSEFGFSDSACDVVFDENSAPSESGSHAPQKSISFWIYDYKFSDSRDSVYEFISNNRSRIEALDTEKLVDAIIGAVNAILD